MSSIRPASQFGCLLGAALLLALVGGETRTATAAAPLESERGSAPSRIVALGDDDDDDFNIYCNLARGDDDDDDFHLQPLPSSGDDYDDGVNILAGKAPGDDHDDDGCNSRPEWCRHWPRSLGIHPWIPIFYLGCGL